jgi:hypothetical protein
VGWRAADVGDLTRGRREDGGAREAGERQGSGEGLGWLVGGGGERTHAREMDPPRMLEIDLEC